MKIWFSCTRVIVQAHICVYTSLYVYVCVCAYPYEWLWERERKCVCVCVWHFGNNE